MLKGQEGLEETAEAVSADARSRRRAGSCLRTRRRREGRRFAGGGRRGGTGTHAGVRASCNGP